MRSLYLSFWTWESDPGPKGFFLGKKNRLVTEVKAAGRDRRSNTIAYDHDSFEEEKSRYLNFLMKIGQTIPLFSILIAKIKNSDLNKLILKARITSKTLASVKVNHTRTYALPKSKKIDMLLN